MSQLDEAKTGRKPSTYLVCFLPDRRQSRDGPFIGRSYHLVSITSHSVCMDCTSTTTYIARLCGGGVPGMGSDATETKQTWPNPASTFHPTTYIWTT